ncbi:MAG: hypothetical protein AAGE89_01900 [Pseudomonadota bacterium]
MKNSLILALSIMIAGTNAVLAQPPSIFVNSHAIEFADGKLTDDQLAHLQNIAHQAATASVCETFALDETKFLAAFADIKHEAEDEMSAEEKAYFDQHVLVIYGMMVGGALADASSAPGAHCSHAEEERSDPNVVQDLLFE